MLVEPRLTMGSRTSDVTTEAIAFLESAGARDFYHSQTTLYEHVVGTGAILRTWHCRPEIVLGGLFHAVYGTMNYRRSLMNYNQRQTVRGLIGRAAERLAFLSCIKTDASLHEAVVTVVKDGASDTEIVDWRSGDRVTVSAQETARLATIVAANALEQVGRSLMTFRRDYPMLKDALPILPSLARRDIDSLSTLIVSPDERW